MKEYLRNGARHQAFCEHSAFAGASEILSEVVTMNHPLARVLIRGEFSETLIHVAANDDGESQLEIKLEEMKFKHDSPSYPRSYCSEECRSDQVRSLD